MCSINDSILQDTALLKNPILLDTPRQEAMQKLVIVTKSKAKANFLPKKRTCCNSAFIRPALKRRSSVPDSSAGFRPPAPPGMPPSPPPDSMASRSAFIVLDLLVVGCVICCRKQSKQSGGVSLALSSSRFETSLLPLRQGSISEFGVIGEGPLISSSKATRKQREGDPEFGLLWEDTRILRLVTDAKRMKNHCRRAEKMFPKQSKSNDVMQ